MQGGSLTLGRHEDCDWQLPDPLRSLSRKHCTVEFYGGVWQVRDLSANGTRINSEADPVGSGLARQLRDGDRLLLGDYEIEVRIEEGMPTLSSPFGQVPASPFGGPEVMTGVFGPGANRGALGGGSNLGGGFGGARLPGLDDPPPYRPFEASPYEGRPYDPPPLDASPFRSALEASPFDDVQSDHAPAGASAYVPPVVLAGAAAPAATKPIPDNWFELEESQLRMRSPVAPPLSAPATARAEAAFPAPAMPPFSEPFPTPSPAAAHPPAPQPAPAVPPPPADVEFDFDLPLTPPVQAASALAPVAAAATPSPVFPPPAFPAAPVPASRGPAASADGAALASALNAFLSGADLPADMVVRASANPEEALRNAGALYRATVSAMRSLLIARGAVKREFRIEQTMIRTRENNPLKFSTSDEQAMAALLDPRTAALGAVQESVADLTGHQVAVMAATQAAARALLKELEPERLLAEDTGGGFLPGALEKRLWEAYKRRHAKLIEQFEDDLKSAFGTAFAKAYEDAVGRGKD